jgi:uncharacterized protein YxjI
VDQQELETWLEHRLEEGYETRELMQVLEQQGVEESRVKRALSDIREDVKSSDQNTDDANAGTEEAAQDSDSTKSEGGEDQDTESQGLVPEVDLDSMSYELVESLILRRYALRSRSGGDVLRAKGEWLYLREEVKFNIPDGKEVFRVKADQLLDSAGSYTVFLPDGTEILTLEKKLSVASENWKVRDESGGLVAEVRGQSKIRTLIRKIGGLIGAVPIVGTAIALPLKLVPRTYNVESPEGKKVAEMDGKVSFSDRFDVDIRSETVPVETLVTSLVCIDAVR